VNDVLVSTSNEDANWTVETLPTPQVTRYALLYSPIFSSLVCESSVSCDVMLSASLGGPNLNAAQYNVFMKADDGGLSWSSTVLPDQATPGSLGVSVDSPSPASMNCPTIQFCVTSAVESLTKSSPSIVWRTVDGGTTWATSGPIWCPDAQHCWTVADTSAGGLTSQLLETSDGGASWINDSPTGLSMAVAWGTVSCPTDNGCWLTGQTSAPDSQSVVYFSADGGQSWTEVPLPSAIGAESKPLKGIDGIDCNTSLTCVALGIPAGVSEDGINEVVLTSGPPPQ
jgi:hypothetical protein